MKSSRLFLAVFSTVSAIGLTSVAIAQNTTRNADAVSPAPGNATNGAPSTNNVNPPNNTDEGTNGTSNAPSTSASAEQAPKPDRN